MLLVRQEIIATVFNLYSHRCIYAFMYLCIYIATHLHTVYLDWLQAVLESNLRWV